MNKIKKLIINLLIGFIIVLSFPLVLLLIAASCLCNYLAGHLDDQIK